MQKIFPLPTTALQGSVLNFFLKKTSQTKQIPIQIQQ